MIAPAGRRRAEQRAGLAPVDPLERFEADLLIGGQQIERLSADQPVGADGVRERATTAAPRAPRS